MKREVGGLSAGMDINIARHSNLVERFATLEAETSARISVLENNFKALIEQMVPKSRSESPWCVGGGSSMPPTRKI